MISDFLMVHRYMGYLFWEHDTHATVAQHKAPPLLLPYKTLSFMCILVLYKSHMKL